MKQISRIALGLFIATMALTSCSKSELGTETPAKPSIYARLGGTTMVQDPDAAAGVMIEKGRLSYRKVVNSTIGLIVADISPTPQPGNLGAHFAPILSETGMTQATSIARLSKNLVDFFSFNTGGTSASNTYTGLNMSVAHNPANNPRMGAKSNTAQYTKFVGYVGAAANTNGVASNTELYTDIVAVMESLRSTIVQI